jgi:hypothetical protein
VLDVDQETVSSSSVYGRNQNYTFTSTAYAAGTLRRFENPSGKGVRVLLFVDSVTTGNGAAATAVLGFGVDEITVTEGGESYETPPTVVITGDGTGAAATAVLTGDVVTSVTVDTAGSGYTSAPVITFEDGGGTGAAATATLLTSGTVVSITVDEGGEGYASAPTVVFTGGGGTGAAATATLAADAVASIAVDTAGSSYETPPVITFTGGGTVGTIKVGIETAEYVSDSRYTLLESATINSTGAKGPYTVYPGAAVTANVSANACVGDDFYVRLTHSAAGLWTYSMTVQLLI